LFQQGQLVEILSDWSGASFPLYALYPSRHLPAAKVRAFVDFVQAHLGATGDASSHALNLSDQVVAANRSSKA
jgi:DNA-binding transcriptional LysR family regulator